MQACSQASRQRPGALLNQWSNPIISPLMYLLPLPAFTDNYIWMLHDGHRALVVDPGDDAPVLRALQASGLQLQTILVTHHHGDHTGAVAALAAQTHAQVLAPQRESNRLRFVHTAVQGGQFCTALGLSWQVLDLPGHTAGHIGFYTPGQDGQAPILFCGDTLFSGGCGRIFEGTPAQMLASLDRLAALPGDTLVCCAHEYTQSNLRFAQMVEPSNAALAAYAVHCALVRAQGGASLPSTMARECTINPFLRTRCPAVAASARAYQADTDEDDPVAVLAALRQWKNTAS